MTVEEYIRKLSLEEKAVLLQGATAWTTWSIPRLLLPAMRLADGPHGLRRQAGKADHLGLNESLPATCFPTAATMANSWDPELGQELGRALGEEAAAQNVHVLLGPGLNIKRNPLCGRNFEYFSEDPYLSGKMAAAYIRGIQETGVAACPKHFAANSQELRRMTVDSVVDERTLRELYLTGFEIAVREGKPKAIMASYNRVNGTYAFENPHLLKEILRDEWGFDGFVVSDWGACSDPAASVAAGGALNMPSPGLDNARSVVEAVREGRLSKEDLDARLRELLPVVLSTVKAVADAPKTFDKDAHHALAQKCAAASIVLLENDGFLPLNSDQKVAVIGDFAQKPRYQGAGSSQVNPTRLDHLYDELKKGGVDVTFAQGFRRGTNVPDRNLIRQAVEAAKNADAVLLCVGLDELAECEGKDRSTLELPKSQLALIQAVTKANENVVLVLSGGAPFDLPDCPRRAVIHGYLSGQGGAEPMVDALMGAVNPSGKLAETWPAALPDMEFPAQGPGALYREGLNVGYRSGESARYPFGHGLSYTKFEYSALEADRRQVRFTLTNTGPVDGAEVVQVYVSCKLSKLARPKRELKAFQKVFLKAGESRVITVELDDKAFRYFNGDTNTWEMETGHYAIEVAASAEDIRLNTTLRLIGTDAAVPEEQFAFPEEAKWSDEIQWNDPISRFAQAKNPVARWICRILEKRIAKKNHDPAATELFVLNLPIRAMAQMTGGKISREMTKDIVFWANGHFWRGLGRLIRGWFRARKADRAFRKILDYGPEDE